MILIGIDPGVTCGVAVAKDRKIRNVMSKTFWETIDFLKALKRNTMAFQVYLENPNFNKPIFAKPGARERGYLRIAQNVGSNKRDAQLILEYCRREKIAVVPVPPLKGRFHKMDAESFATFTGYKGKTSQHGRDAAGLIWGM